MVDYLASSGAVSTTDTFIRIAAGVAIGGLDESLALYWSPAATGSLQLLGALYASDVGLFIDGVDSDVLVQSTGSIFGGGASIIGQLRNLTNFGTIATYVSSAAATFTVRNYGLIADDVSGAIAHAGTGTASITNAGSIIGSDGAVSLRGTGGNTIVNSGTITSMEPLSTSPLIGSFNSSLTLTNYGTIAAGAGPAILTATDASTDKITNLGLITGGILLGGGDDQYDNMLGTVTGLVDLGQGNDDGIGGAGRDEMNGGADADTLTGNGGDDLLNGGDGNDAIDGGTGADRMTGGAGNDRFFVDSAQDVVIEAASGGVDTITTSVSYTLRANQAIEVLFASPEEGVTGLSLTGNTLVQTITGDAGNNRITGGGGADALYGLAGDDTYVVSDGGTRVIEQVREGTDTVLTSVSYVLSDNIETLRASGSAAIDLTGNTLANTIVGNAGANVIDGGAGTDRMVGGLGDDIYYVDSAGDAVADSGGADTVRATIDYTLGKTIETLILDGFGDIDGTGNGLANQIVGNGGANVLSGRGGLDTLTGGDGADTFLFGTKAAVGSLATITDFLSGTDHIALDDSAFRRVGGPGALDPAFFTDRPATNADHHILYDAATGTLSYDADGSGAKYDAIAFAHVTAGITLTAADIFVI